MLSKLEVKNLTVLRWSRMVTNFFVHIFKLSKSTTMAERKAVIKNADMSEDMQQDAVDCASQALEKYNIEKVSG